MSSCLTDLRGDKALLTSENEFFPVVASEVSFSLQKAKTLLVLAKIMQRTPFLHKVLKEFLSALIHLSESILQIAVQLAY